jgi:Tetratricopeptide repeat
MEAGFGGSFDSPLEEAGFELVVPDFRETFRLYRFRVANWPGATPVLTTDNGTFTVGRARLAPGLSNLAGLLTETNRHAEAEPLYRRALAIFEKSFGSDHPNVGIVRDDLASLMKDTTRQPKAETT